MSVRQHILTISFGLLFVMSQGQSVEAGFIASEIGSVSPTQLASLSTSGCSAAAVSESQSDSPVDATQQLFFKSLHAQPVGSGNHGTSAGGTNVTGAGPGSAPAAMLEAASLYKSHLFSYLLDEPELKISPPYSDGIFRPPTGKFV